MTPFARFFIVMLIIVPIAYFGASWYNGDDPLGLRDKIGLDGTKTEQAAPVQPNGQAVTIDELEARISQLERELQQCRQELQDLKTNNPN